MLSAPSYDAEVLAREPTEWPAELQALHADIVAVLITVLSGPDALAGAAWAVRDIAQNVVPQCFGKDEAKVGSWRVLSLGNKA